MEAQIQIRRSTAAQWISANPILTPGEPGLELDTGKGKYGDGITHWNALGYSWALLGGGPQGPAGGSLAGTYPNPTLALNTVGPPQIIDGGVGSAELATGAVTTAKIGDSQVTGVKLADGAVVLAKLAANSVDSSKIVDGSIALADLSPAALASLSLDIADEGAVVQADATMLNFVGDGVQVGSAGGVATVTVSGVAASAVLPGTIAEWYDVTPPVGWYLCDGAVHADLGGTIGSRFGPSAGTVPNFAPTPIDSYTTTISDVVASTQPGWHVDSLMARISHGQVTITWQCSRTGADIAANNPNHADQAMFILKAPYIPEYTLGGGLNNAPRWFNVSASTGSVAITAGFTGNVFNSADILKDDVHTGSLNFPVHRTNTLPKVYKIIKAPVTV